MIKTRLLLTVFAAAMTFTTLASAAVVTHNRGGSSRSADVDQCKDEMGYLRSIRVAEVQNIFDERVVLIPVCDTGSITGGSNDVGSLFSEGNVSGLRSHIARNDTLSAALEDRRYDAEDVVGMRFGNGSVILYVHQR